MKLLINERQFNSIFKEAMEIDAPYKFLHGGNLDNFVENKTPKSGRYEYGPGLYLIDNYNAVEKYTKGSRKLYIVTVKKGNDLNNALLDFEMVKDFVDSHIPKRTGVKIINNLGKYVKDGKLKAYLLDVALINEKAIMPSKTKDWREFYINNGIDYHIIDSPYGWNEKMMVLYNMRNILNVHRVKSFDEIDEFL